MCNISSHLCNSPTESMLTKPWPAICLLYLNDEEKKAEGLRKNLSQKANVVGESPWYKALGSSIVHTPQNTNNVSCK